MDDIYIRRVLEGDIQSFRYFIDKYKDMSFSVALSVVKDHHVAEEIVQDAFLNAFKGLSSFKQQSKFSTWLYRIVVNESFNRQRKLAHDKNMVRLDDKEIDAPEINNAISMLTSQEQKEFINLALDKLPSKESLLLRLFYLDEKSVEEIAEITGLSQPNIKVILFRARKEFFIVLQKQLKHEVKSLL